MPLNDQMQQFGNVPVQHLSQVVFHLQASCTSRSSSPTSIICRSEAVSNYPFLEAPDTEANWGSGSSGGIAESHTNNGNRDSDSNTGDESNYEDEVDEENYVGNEERLTFEEAMKDHIEIITEFAKGLDHQIQFHDQRMLRILEREGASFL